MILIKNGRVLTAEKSFIADVLIDGEKIIAVGAGLDYPNAEIIDAKGKLVMPGGIDPHTHFDLPMFGTVSSDDHYTGHKAAAFGGTTTVIDFVPLNKDLGILESVRVWREKADNNAVIDFSFHMNITHLNDQLIKEIPKLIEQGITTLKVFSAYNDRLRLDDDEILRVLKLARELGMLVMLHAEDGDAIEALVDEAISKGHTDPIWHAKTRPSSGAVEAVRKGVEIAALADATIFVAHMNTGGGADELKEARKRSVKAMGETCPQYLFFTEEEYLREDGSKWICSPPMRSSADSVTPGPFAASM